MLSTYSYGQQIIGNLYIFLCGVAKPLAHYPFILLGVFHLFMYRNLLYVMGRSVSADLCIANIFSQVCGLNFILLTMSSDADKVLIFMIQSISLCVCVWLVTYMYYLRNFCLPQVNKNSESNLQHKHGSVSGFFSILDHFQISILYH